MADESQDPEAPSFGASDPTDGRPKFDWKSRYPSEALRIIRTEAIILSALFLLSLTGIFLVWCDAIVVLLNYCCGETNIQLFKHYSYFSFAGLLGGTIYSIKYLYHAVARGTWHIDRQLWRFLSPLMSFGVAFIVGALVQADVIGQPNPAGSVAITIGFVAGYFSDSAIAKMYEIANAFFGTSSKPFQGK